MKHILMVDDVTTNLKSAAEVLQPYYQLSMAKSGKQALQFLKKNIPDLILLDLMMPEMDGYETMEQIKLNPMTAKIPIIFLTADTEQSSEIRGLQMGAMDYITKPFRAEAMLGRIEKVLQMEDMKKSLLSNSGEDAETGLLTRKAVAAQIVQKASQSEGTAILINFDDFGIYNDACGMEEGNRILKDFADYIKDLCEEQNTYGEIRPARLSFDEFLMYLPLRIEEEGLKQICEEKIPAFFKEVSGQGKKTLTTSVAVAYMYPDSMDFEALYQNLMRAMYHVKQSGKNSWHLYRE